MLNKAKNNMYEFCDFTWNPIRGKCTEHNCSYCYMKKFKVGELRLDEKALFDNLGKGKFIFVGSSTDMWAKNVLSEWIVKVLDQCNMYPENAYLFQSKNPARFEDFLDILPKNSILGTTIETDKYRIHGIVTLAPDPLERATALAELKWNRKFVSIEPIMEFDIDTMVKWIRSIRPAFISIGADSKRSNLPEPSPEKVRKLIEELGLITEIHVKNNLKRLVEVKK